MMDATTDLNGNNNNENVNTDKKVFLGGEWSKSTTTEINEEKIREDCRNLLPGVLSGCICDIYYCSLTICVH